MEPLRRLLRIHTYLKKHQQNELLTIVTTNVTHNQLIKAETQRNTANVMKTTERHVHISHRMTKISVEELIICRSTCVVSPLLRWCHQRRNLVVVELPHGEAV